MDKERLIARQSELIQIVESIDSILHSRDWQVVRKVFDTRAENLESQLLTEAKAEEPSMKKVYRLQGRISEIKRYDLASYAEDCKKELQGIKQQIQ